MNTPREITNPQTLWKKFKDDIKKLAKTSADKSYHKITSKIEKLKDEVRTLANHPDIDGNKGVQVKEAFAAHELAHLEKIVACDQKDHTKAMLANHGEKLRGPWSAISKDKKPRDLILQLKIPGSNPPRFERCTRQMAKLARDYHESLQYNSIGLPNDHPEYETNVRTILSEIPPNQCLSEVHKNAFEWRIKPSHVREALLLAKSKSATGVDSLPYELWKNLDNKNEKAGQEETESFDIAETLATVFQDIQDYGVDDRWDFALGWMCLIYKKRDKKDIATTAP